MDMKLVTLFYSKTQGYWQKSQLFFICESEYLEIKTFWTIEDNTLLGKRLG